MEKIEFTKEQIEKIAEDISIICFRSNSEAKKFLLMEYPKVKDVLGKSCIWDEPIYNEEHPKEVKSVLPSFEAVHTFGSSALFKPTLAEIIQACNRGKAKAIALERFHALLAVESSHFPMLRCVRIVCPLRSYKIWESLVFGYFDYKAYFCPKDGIETTQDLFMKIKDYLPMPLTEEDENNIDWQNLIEETCLQLMRSHGLDIELEKDLSYVYYD